MQGFDLRVSKNKNAKNIDEPDRVIDESEDFPNFEENDGSGLFPHSSRFSPDEQLVVISTEVNNNDKSVLEILKNKFNEYLGGKKIHKNLVRLINFRQEKPVKEFIIDNFNYAKFSPDGGKVALFTTENGGQCFIADAKNADQKEALLLPLADIKFGDFSSDGKKFVTAVGEDIYIFNTSNASLTHKSKVPFDAEIVKNLKEKEFKPQGQTIEFVKFIKNDELEIGRQISYTGIRENLQDSNRVSPNANVFTNSNPFSVNISIPTISTARISNEPSQESFTDFGCYGINQDGILVAKSRCGN